MSDEAPLIIAGMHRSGTSVVSRLLERAGLYVGGSWVDENHESYHFSRANRAMIGEGAFLLYEFGWTAPKTDAFIEARRGYAERAVADIGRFFAERAARQPWGWKDPRNCLTLLVWLPIFPAARVVHVVRDGRAVALSLADRDALHPAFGLALWAHYVTRAERALEAVPAERKLTVRFEDVSEAPEETLRALLQFAQLEPLEPPNLLVAQVDTTRVGARLADPRLAEVGEHPLLARYGYG